MDVYHEAVDDGRGQTLEEAGASNEIGLFLRSDPITGLTPSPQGSSKHSLLRVPN